MGMPKFLKVSLLIVVPFMWFILIVQLTGKACISYQGFAVDPDGNIYLGKDKGIEVLNKEGELINKIKPMTSRGYRFTLTENGEILISTGDYWYRKDLSENIIEKGEITTYEDDPVSTLGRYKYTTSDGTAYVMKMYFFRTNIYKITGKTRISVYQMPLFDYFVRILSIVVYATFVTVTLIGIKAWRKAAKSKSLPL